MSKANEWANALDAARARHGEIKGARPEYRVPTGAFGVDQRIAAVDDNGDLNFIGAPQRVWTSDEALAFARWLINTFSDFGEDTTA